MIIGIDLGTTNSLVAVWKDGQAQIIPNALGQRLTPSIVGIDDNDDILIGQAAKERLLVHPDKTVANFKRYMGTSRVLQLGKLDFRPEELSALVLKSLKADAENWLSETVTEAVVTVPAYFSDTQRKATKAAGELAGLKVERLLNEPTAAALAYGLHKADSESQFLVFDLGGGTFDVSILELFEGVMEVRATAGDTYLGGEDFVDRLIELFMQQIGRPAGMAEKHLAGTFYQKLRQQAEKAKRNLTESDSATIRVNWNNNVLSWEFTSTQFSEYVEPLLQKLRAPVERALRDATIRSKELNEVVLVGGATRMPIIRKMVARMFGRLPSGYVNPDEVVVLGSAIQAGLKVRDAALSEVVLTDVCPYTLGIETVQRVGQIQQTGHYLPILDRNTIVPVSRVEQVTTVSDYQQAVDLKIFQGESRLVKDNIYLGNLKVTVPPGPAGDEVLEVRFTYDINGLLEVQAKVKSSEQQCKVVLEENPGILAKDEIEKRFLELDHLKIHPREQTENRTLLARAERLYEEYIGEIRHHIGRGIAEFQAIMAKQDVREIEKARIRFEQALNELEQDPFW